MLPPDDGRLDVDHVRRHPTDVDSGVAAVNKILKSVYENRHNPRTW